MYRLKITYFDGSDEVQFSEILDFNFYDLSRGLDKCKVKEFKVGWV